MGEVRTLDVVPMTAELVEAPELSTVVDVLAAGSRSFHFASLFLPADRRADAALLYAFCRYVDDLADEAPDAASALCALQDVAAEVRGQVPPRPFIAALLDLFTRHRIDPRHALDLIEGVSSDLGVVRLPDDAALVRYSYRVASTVGLMMCGVLGVRDPAALPHAVDLGVAMQITNICRDVAEDARNDRVYLPATRLRALGLSGAPDQLLRSRAAVGRVVTDLLGVAERYYQSAEAGMRFIPWRARLAILVASRVYRAIGLQLGRAGGDALAGRTVVSTGAKIRHALLAFLAFPSTFRPARQHRASLHRAIATWPGANPSARED